LFQELAKLGHGIAARGNTQNIVDKALNELLGNIFTAEIAIRELPGGEKFVEGDGLCSKGDRLLLFVSHAANAPVLRGFSLIMKKLYWRDSISSSVQKIQELLRRKTDDQAQSGSTRKKRSTYRQDVHMAPGTIVTRKINSEKAEDRIYRLCPSFGNTQD
jgi:hypothetical protein